MKYVSKPLYLGGYISGFALGAVMMVAGVVLDGMEGRSKSPVGPSAMCMGMVSMFGGIIVYLMLISRMWAALMRGPIQPRTTPGQAVGFLFIPFYNLYWIFQAIYGWTQDYNRYVEKANLDVPRMPETLALALCIVQLCGIIPFFGYLMLLPQVILTAIFISFACDGINALADARQSAHAEERFSADNPFAN